MKHFLCVLLLAAHGAAQVAEHANTAYKTKEGRERIAKTLAAEDRDGRQKPQELVDAMQLKAGMTVADLGTGVGYMLPYLSRAVGPSGRVLAQDIFEDFLDKARATTAREKLGNVEFVQGSENDAKLPLSAVDVVLALDAYHHFNYPEQMLASISKALRPGGRLVIVDFYKNGFPDPEHIRLDEADVIQEIEANGFRLLSRREHMPKTQYMAIFEKK